MNINANAAKDYSKNHSDDLCFKLIINGKTGNRVKLDIKVNKINTLVSMRSATCGQHSSRSSGHLEERGVSVSPGAWTTWTFPRDVTLPHYVTIGQEEHTAGARCPLMSACYVTASWWQKQGSFKAKHSKCRRSDQHGKSAYHPWFPVNFEFNVNNYSQIYKSKSHC